MSISINEQDLAVAEIISSYSVSYLGERVDENKWISDKWIVTINGVDFEYHTGTGHRLEIGIGRYSLTSKQNKEVKELKECTKLDKVLFTIKDRRLYAVAPTQASVLYCIVSDSYASEVSFDDWCSDLGYDSDSRKALDVYLQCQENSKKLQQVFRATKGTETTYTMIEKLKEILEDY